VHLYVRFVLLERRNKKNLVDHDINIILMNCTILEGEKPSLLETK
jgi:hypothetical protein